MTGMTHAHVDPPTIPLIKQRHGGKPDKCFVKFKLRRDPTSSTSGLYEFKMSLFDNGDSELFLLFIRHFNMTLMVSGMLDTGAKYQYLCTHFCIEAFLQFDSLSTDAEGTKNLNVDLIIRGLAE